MVDGEPAMDKEHFWESEIKFEVGSISQEGAGLCRFK
jgi:hypothetical protein